MLYSTPLYIYIKETRNKNFVAPLGIFFGMKFLLLKELKGVQNVAWQLIINCFKR
jgi:hypothetical protein